MAPGRHTLGACIAALAIAVASGAWAAAPPLLRWASPPTEEHLVRRAWATELKTVDLNGDGLRDVVATQVVFGRDETVPVDILLNRGNGKFVLATSSIFEDSR